MKKLLTSVLALALISTSAFAQFGFSRAINATSNAIKSSNASANTKSTSSSSSSSQQTTKSSSASSKENNGTVYYVNAETGGNRNDGKSPSTAFKDIQKLLNSDFVKDGDIIRVSEGNYLGYMGQGFIEIKKYVTIQGGWNSSFTEWNPVKYRTMVQPTAEQKGTNGSKSLFTISCNTDKSRSLIIDGILFDCGFENDYKHADPKDPATGTCEGCETGRMLDEQSPSFTIMKGEVGGHFVVRNCLFLNSNDYGLWMANKGGHWEVYNNVFVACRYAACEIRGAMATRAGITLDFHHNTVVFSWCRTKVMEDMGYGFRFMNGMEQEDVHHNIFGCSNLGAIDNCRFESDKSLEAGKIQNVENNYFFLNNADMVLPSGGGKWLMVKAEQFEDVDRIKGYEGNKQLPASSNIFKLLNQPQLKGWMKLKVTTNQSYDPNSAANQYRSALGMNQVGTETVRVSMYGNRYPFEDAMKLFGAENGYGAQMPK